MSKGKQPKFFEVGIMNVDGSQKVEVMPTAQVHQMISAMNGNSNIATMVIKKKPKQTKIYGDSKNYK